MNESKIVVRYTKALFNLALEKDQLTVVANDFEKIKQILNEEDKIRKVLFSPVLKKSAKKSAAKSLFTEFLHPLTNNFIQLIIDSGRESYLNAFIRHYTRLYREYSGITHAVITTAVPISKQMLDKIEKIMAEKDFKGLDLEQNTKEDILGGFILRIDDMQYDGSIATNLNKIKTTLKQTSVINK